jgi:hypothetical protein
VSKGTWDIRVVKFITSEKQGITLAVGGGNAENTGVARAC